jgi:hypothetical protein
VVIENIIMIGWCELPQIWVVSDYQLVEKKQVKARNLKKQCIAA